MSAKKVKEIPKETLHIGGIVHTISREPLGENHGEYNCDTKVLKIDNTGSEESQDQCVAHEIIHAAFYTSGLHYILETHGELEEAIVRCIENIALPAIYEYNKRKGVK
jgi:hypothetical protein